MFYPCKHWAVANKRLRSSFALLPNGNLRCAVHIVHPARKFLCKHWSCFACTVSCYQEASSLAGISLTSLSGLLKSGLFTSFYIVVGPPGQVLHISWMGLNLSQTASTPRALLEWCWNVMTSLFNPSMCMAHLTILYDWWTLQYKIEGNSCSWRKLGTDITISSFSASINGISFFGSSFMQTSFCSSKLYFFLVLLSPLGSPAYSWTHISLGGSKKGLLGTRTEGLRT